MLGYIYPLITTPEPLEIFKSVSRVFSVKYSIVFKVFKVPTPNRQNPKVYISRQEILFIDGLFNNQNKCTYSDGKGDVLY